MLKNKENSFINKNIILLIFKLFFNSFFEQHRYLWGSIVIYVISYLRL
jgi:hypothetical protein